MRWREVELSSVPTLAPSTTYWVVVGRTGSNDADDCFHVELSTEAGAAGTYKYWDGSAWQTRSGVDMPFDLLGGLETTDMIEDALDATQFVSAVQIANQSNVRTLLYQIDNLPVQSVIEDWLAIGTDSATRLLATWGREFAVRVFAEPTAGAADYRRDREGRITTNTGVIVHPHRFRAGVWMTSEDVLLAGPAGSELASAGRAFIEESEWTFDNKIRLLPRGVKSPWEA